MNHEQFCMLNTTAVYLALFTLPIFSTKANPVWLVFFAAKKNALALYWLPTFFKPILRTAISTTLTLRPTRVVCITCTLTTLNCVAV